MTPDIPVTIVAGYLGAGKTTLINRLLSAGAGARRVAVLVNDFGSINIDAGLIRAHDGETISLTNGCVCCTIGDDLGGALSRLVAAARLPEHIVIEASGVAEPAKLARYGADWPGVTLAGLLCLADAETVRARARDKFVGKLVQRQIAAADRILVTHTDLLDTAEAAEAKKWLGRLAPGAALLDVNAPRFDPAVCLAAGAAHELVQDVGEGTPAHETLTFTGDVALDRSRFEAFLDAVPPAIVRAKGYVTFAGEEGRYLLQLAGARWSLTREPAGPGGGAGLVFIAPAGMLERERLRAGLDACRARSAVSGS